MTDEKLRMLTIKEAATEFPGLTAHHIRQLVRTDTLPYLMAGKKYLICDRAIRDYILRNATNGDILLSQDTPYR